MGFIATLLAALYGAALKAILTALGALVVAYRAGKLKQQRDDAQASLAKEHDVDDAVAEIRARPVVVDRDWVRRHAEGDDAAPGPHP